MRVIPLPQEGTAAQERQCLVSSHSGRHRRDSSWVTWPHRPPPLRPRGGVPSPTSAAGRRSARLGRLLSPAHVPQEGSFLGPGLFSLPGGSSRDRVGKKAAKGDRKIISKAFSGEKYYRSKREFFLYWIISNHGYNRKT